MSWPALLQAVVDQLQSSFKWKDKDCKRSYHGMPPPMAGDLFVGVWRGQWTNDQATCFDGHHEVNVTISQRLKAPYDRISEDMLQDASDGIDVWAKKIAAEIHRDCLDYRICNRANVILGKLGSGVTGNGFVEPLRFRGDNGEAVLVGGDWFKATAGDMAGITQTLRFGFARRIELLAYAT